MTTTTPSKPVSTVSLKGSAFALLFAQVKEELVTKLSAKPQGSFQKSDITKSLAKNALRLAKEGQFSFFGDGDVAHRSTANDDYFIAQYLAAETPDDTLTVRAEKEAERYFVELDYVLSLQELESLELKAYTVSGKSGPEGYCFCCGHRTRFQMSQRADVLYERVNRVQDSKTPAACFDDQSRRELEIEFPSGEVFVGDWLRLEALTKATEVPSELTETPGYDVNSVRGRVNTMEYLLKAFNMLSIPASSGHTGLYADKATGAWAVGPEYVWDKEKDMELIPGKQWKKRSKIDSTYRAVTFWDLQDAAALLVKLGKAKNATEAKKLIRAAVKEDDQDPTIVRVPAGKYKARMLPWGQAVPVEQLSEGCADMHAVVTLTPVVA